MFIQENNIYLTKQQQQVLPQDYEVHSCGFLYVLCLCHNLNLKYASVCLLYDCHSFLCINSKLYLLMKAFTALAGQIPSETSSLWVDCYQSQRTTFKSQCSPSTTCIQGDGTQVFRVSGICLYPLSNLTSNLVIFNSLNISCFELVDLE